MKIRNTFYLTSKLQIQLYRLAKAKKLSRTSIIETSIALLLSADAQDRQ